MKKHLVLFLICFIWTSIFAQTAFDFEASALPSQWKAENGKLSLTGEHYKEGATSLCWTTKGKSILEITPSKFTTLNNQCVNFQLYSPVINNDTLKVDFYCDKSIVRSMNICLNFKGWRTISRAYSEFTNNSESSISSIELTLITLDTKTARSICFDEFNFLSNIPANRLLGTQWVKEFGLFSDKNVNKLSIESYSYPVDIEVVKPTSAEMNAVNAFKRNAAFQFNPKEGNPKELAAAISYVEGMQIVRNHDGSVHGNVVDLKPGSVNVELMTKLSRHLEVLAADASSSDLFKDLLDHLLDQGFAEGVEYLQMHNNYIASRVIPKSLLAILPSCTKTQKEDVLNLCKWILLYNDLYFPQGQYLDKLNSDKVYLFCPYLVAIALSQPTAELTVRELKAFKRWLDRNSDYVPGGKDFLKPDGSGYHHNTHLNGYMRAYKTYAQYMKYLAGTPFRVEKQSYEHLKKAVITQFITGSLNSDGTSNNAYSLSGRAGYADAIPCSKFDLENLMAVGIDLCGNQDDELAAAYNYFLQSTKYKVPTAAVYSGFYALNYSPVCIYRQDKWVVTMRSPTKTVKGSEIFPDANRFGRYQSHGTLEVLYDGLEASGYPTEKANPSGGGWDWNVVPGATTVHYTNWVDLVPTSSGSNRFDQYTKTKTFSGGLSWGDLGLFACDFDQIDSWGGKQLFEPTNLVFKKTVLAVDKLLIDIGTNIGTSGAFAGTMNTATNLFQSVIASSTKDLQVNGTSISSSYSTPLIANSANTILSPTGTGYIIPKGNDAVSVFYGSQSSPKKDASDVANPTTSLTAAKAYIVHGKNPKDKNYQFVVAPGTTVKNLSTLASEVNAGKTYQLVQADSFQHVIHYKPKNLMAYTFFKPAENVNDTAFHLVKAISSEALLLERKSLSSDSSYEFAIANPNLRPVADSKFLWLATPTNTVLTLKGKWLLKTGTLGVSIVSASSVDTKIQILIKDGEAQYFTVDIDISI